MTIRLFSVRPISSLGSRREGPSTSTRWRVPIMPWAMAAACWLMSACNCCRRRSLTSCGVSSCRSAAGVPGRREYTNENEVSKPTSSISFMVFWKSSSVSPGKPTMKSEDSVRLGRAARRRRTTDLNSSAV
ncbi:Uncharacterised protein [Bordetella pertussis]|nr:Uncharacterised protein [Bordetella pertussis]